MNKIELDIAALSHSVTHSHNYAVVLGEVEGQRRLPIVIGGFEAQAIAVALENMAPNRPLTHDLFKNSMDIFDIQLKEVVINNLLDGIFYSKLVCVQNGNLFEIDSRTSDAIALAVRFECPIYTFEFIMESAGLIMDDDESADKTPRKKTVRKASSYKELSVPELKEMLDKVLNDENYEKAAKIRDELNKR